jgi:hypothetical protein
MSQQTAIGAGPEGIVSKKSNGAITQRIAMAQYVSGWKTYGFSFGVNNVSLLSKIGRRLNHQTAWEALNLIVEPPDLVGGPR